METLFPVQQNFHIVRLTEEDAARSTDALKMFGEQLSLNEEMYPDIKKWLRNKVIPGLRDGSRVAYLGFEGELPILTAVVKRGEHSKFCHLRIASEFQDLHLGEVFFSIMALEIRNTSKEIHFTLPEGLWEKRREFFTNFGFRDVTRARTQYRLFEKELRTSAPFWDVWRAARKRIPRLMNCFSINSYTMSPNLLLSVKPEFANHLMSGEKTIEVRRRFNRRWLGARVAIYASSPERALVGEATIHDVKSAPPGEIWHQYGRQIGCTHKDFQAYAGTSEKLFAIQLQDVIPYVSKMPVCQFEYLLEEELTPPQSHCEIRENHSWGKAISIAALLHGCQRLPNPRRNATII
jgi:predicted transcriptional regulator